MDLTVAQLRVGGTGANNAANARLNLEINIAANSVGQISAVAIAEGAIAVGNAANATGVNSIAIGNAANATVDGAISIGAGIINTTVNTIEIGTESNTFLTIAANGVLQVIPGYESFLSDGDDIPNKQYVDDTGGDPNFVGDATAPTGTTATGDRSIAMAPDADAGGIDAISIGSNSSASETRSISIGDNINTTVADTINIGANGNTKLTMEADGTLNVAVTTNYETLVTADDDIPNKKYVDDNIAGSAGNPNYTGEAIAPTGTSATGIRSLAMGPDALATGLDAIAIGSNANAVGINAIAIGNSANANSEGTIAIGSGIVNIANNTFAIGTQGNTWLSSVSSGLLRVNPTINYETLVIADDDIPNKKYVDDNAGGGGGDPNFVGDAIAPTGVIATGDRAIAIAPNAEASGDDAIAIGSNSEAGGNWSIALGKDSTAGVSQSIVIGQSIVNNDVNSIKLGTNGNTLLQLFANGALDVSDTVNYETKISADDHIPNIKWVNDNIVSGDPNFVGEASGTLGITASGLRAIGVAPDATASGSQSIALGANTLADGSNAIAIGTNAVADSSFDDIAIGSNTLATGLESIAIGKKARADGRWSSALGNQSRAGDDRGTAIGAFANAFAEHSVALGPVSLADTVGKIAFSGGDNFGVIGDSGVGIYILRHFSVSSAEQEMFLADDASRMVLANNTSWIFDIQLIARDNTTSRTNAYKYTGVINREDNATTTNTHVISETIVHEDELAWSANVNANPNFGALTVQVTGAASQNVRWVATCRTSEVTFA